MIDLDVYLVNRFNMSIPICFKFLKTTSETMKQYVVKKYQNLKVKSSLLVVE